MKAHRHMYKYKLQLNTPPEVHPCVRSTRVFFFYLSSKLRVTKCTSLECAEQTTWFIVCCIRKSNCSHHGCDARHMHTVWRQLFLRTTGCFVLSKRFLIEYTHGQCSGGECEEWKCIRITHRTFPTPQSEWLPALTEPGWPPYQWLCTAAAICVFCCNPPWWWLVQ